MGVARTAIVALAICACRPSSGSDSPTDPDGAHVLRLDLSALRTADCSIQIDSILGPPGSDVGASLRIPLEFSGSDRELAIRMRSAQSFLQLPGVEIRNRVTPELIEEPTDQGEHVIRRAADDPAARAEIAALLGAPHAFLRLDDHAGVLDYREEIDTKVQLGDVDAVGLAWALPVPHLPVEPVRKGDEWLGVRYLARDAAFDPDSGVPVRYRLTKIRRGVATIAITGGVGHDLEAGGKVLAMGVSIHGEAQVRISDGRPLATGVRVLLRLGSKGTSVWEWRYVGSCKP